MRQTLTRLLLLLAAGGLAGLCTPSAPAGNAASPRVRAAVPATPAAVAARIEQVSRGYLGTPYRRDPLGEGPAGDVDCDPLCDRKRVDCVTFVEQVLAEATAAQPGEMLARLQRIRYGSGEIGFRTRNHFTVTDWLPHNAWLVRDVTEALAPGRTRSMVKMIDRRAFLQGRGCDAAGAGQERCETRYLPREAVPALAARIPTATLAILVQRRPGIIASHCGWLLRPSGKPLTLRHASSRHGCVVDEPFLEFLRRQPRNIAGVKLCVVRGL